MCCTFKTKQTVCLLGCRCNQTIIVLQAAGRKERLDLWGGKWPLWEIHHLQSSNLGFCSRADSRPEHYLCVLWDDVVSGESYLLFQLSVSDGLWQRTCGGESHTTVTYGFQKYQNCLLAAHLSLHWRVNSMNKYIMYPLWDGIYCSFNPAPSPSILPWSFSQP